MAMSSTVKAAAQAAATIQDDLMNMRLESERQALIELCAAVVQLAQGVGGNSVTSITNGPSGKTVSDGDAIAVRARG